MTQKKFTRAYARRIIDKVLKTLTLVDILSKKNAIFTSVWYPFRYF